MIGWSGKDKGDMVRNRMIEYERMGLHRAIKRHEIGLDRMQGSNVKVEGASVGWVRCKKVE